MDGSMHRYLEVRLALENGDGVSGPVKEGLVWLCGRMGGDE
jgi:hypothetical protein